MRVAIHQPQYLPWLGYFDKLDSADVFIILDTVQLKKHEWQDRNRIRTKNSEGWQWLKVPILDPLPRHPGSLTECGRPRTASAVHQYRPQHVSCFRMTPIAHSAACFRPD